MPSPSPVTAIPAAASDQALEHFSSLLSLETDCWDVHEAISSDSVDFVLLDVRSPELFAAGHLPGAINLPHRRIVDRNLEQYLPSALFVVYCAGPHCNGADKAAMRLAALDRPVKKISAASPDGWTRASSSSRTEPRRASEPPGGMRTW